ncbi:hypothetical protein CKA32_005161 [Geitlerinema sp. FC II]|nr:hypothetical protein CKA32_005161 [Geitlerinema sp. FC II]
MLGFAIAPPNLPQTHIFTSIEMNPIWVHLTFAKTSVWGGKIPD